MDEEQGRERKKERTRERIIGGAEIRVGEREPLVAGSITVTPVNERARGPIMSRYGSRGGGWPWFLYANERSRTRKLRTDDRTSSGEDSGEIG